MTGFNNMPIEILVDIFFRADFSSLSNFSLVNKKFYAAATSQILWRDFFKTYFPHYLSHFTESELKDPHFNWRQTFIITYQKEYKTNPNDKEFIRETKKLRYFSSKKARPDVPIAMEKSTIKLFNLAKEKNNSELIKKFDEIIQLGNIGNDFTLLLNGYFYAMGVRHTDFAHLDSSNFSLGYWLQDNFDFLDQLNNRFMKLYNQLHPVYKSLLYCFCNNEEGFDEHLKQTQEIKKLLIDLDYSCMYGRLEMVKKIFEKIRSLNPNFNFNGPEIGEATGALMSFIYTAAKNNHADVVSFLIANGVTSQLNLQGSDYDYDLNTPIIWAVQHGNLPLIKILCAENIKNLDVYNTVSVAFTFGGSIYHPISLAIRNNQREITQYLLSQTKELAAGEEFRASQTRAEIPLCLNLAIERDNLVVIAELLRLKVNPNLKDCSTNETALEAAIRKDYKEAIEILKQFGAVATSTHHFK